MTARDLRHPFRARRRRKAIAALLAASYTTEQILKHLAQGDPS